MINAPYQAPQGAPPPCPCCRCGAPLPHESVNPRDALARCPRCGAHTDVRRAPDFLATRWAFKIAGAPAAKITQRSTPGRLELSYPWRTWQSFVTLPVLALLGGGILFGFVSSIASGSLEAIGYLPFVAVIGVIAFAQIRFAVNRTTIVATPDLLRIDKTPLPARGWRLRIDPRAVAALYTVHSGGNRGQITGLTARLRDGTELELVSDLYEPVEAFTLEAALEQFYGLRDDFVPGEHLPTRWPPFR